SDGAGATGRAGAGPALAAGRWPHAAAAPHRAAVGAGVRVDHLGGAACRAPLGRHVLGLRHALDQPGADQPDPGVERAGRARLGGRVEARPAHAVAGRRGADGGGAGQAGAGRSPAPGQPARHRLVHRLRPALHGGRLVRAGAAARSGRRWRWRSERSDRMKRIGRRLAFLCALAVSLAASAAVPADYATQWPLTLGRDGEGAYRVALDAGVYRQLQDPALRDLVVLNRDGSPVPAGLFAPEDALAKPARRIEVPWFALPAPAAD